MYFPTLFEIFISTCIISRGHSIPQMLTHLIFIMHIPKAGKVGSSVLNDQKNLRWLSPTETRLSDMLASLPSSMW